MQETIKCPKSLQYMVEQSNQRLKEMQDTFTSQIIEATQELMEILNISSQDGWKVDLDNMVFVREVPDEDNASVSE